MTETVLHARRAWSHCGAARTTGRAFIDDRLYDAADLAGLLDTCATFDRFVQTVERLNGHFAAIVEREATTWLACDRLRTIPLFYTVRGRPAVGDDGEAVALAGGDMPADPISTEEFYLAGFVTGSHTRLSALRQVRSGEAVELTEGPEGTVARPRRYWQFRQRDELPDDIPSLFPAYGEALRNATGRLIEVAAGRRIALALSGGYDSRSLALTLVELGYRDLVAYTYGAEDCSDVVTGREVAAQLGIPWHHVPYSAAVWHEAVRTQEWRDFLRHAGTAASLPCLQDWPAVRDLTAQGVLTSDDLVAPGYAGEVKTPAGSGAPGAPMTSDRVFVAGTLAYHYNLWPWRRAQRRVRIDIGRRVLESVGPLAAHRTVLSADEAFNLNERQAKFIANAVRSLEFVGLDWWLPLYDAEFMEFWERAPHAARHNRALLYAYTDDLTRRLLPHPERLVGRGQSPDPPPQPRRIARDAMRWVYRRATGFPPLRTTRRARSAAWAQHVYATHPLRWYGVVSQDRFAEAWLQGAANINSLLTAQILGRMEFD